MVVLAVMVIIMVVVAMIAVSIIYCYTTNYRQN